MGLELAETYTDCAVELHRQVQHGTLYRWDIDNVADQVGDILDELANSGQMPREEADLIFNAWYRIFHYGRD